ncbi:MAG: hypothetical protein AAF513_02290 [Pseudomonadota bacterium]
MQDDNEPSDAVEPTDRMRRRRPRRAYGIDRAAGQKKHGLRLVRTIALGFAATVAALIWIADQYGIERAVMLEFVQTSLMFVLGLAAAGAIGAGALILIKRFLG